MLEQASETAVNTVVTIPVTAATSQPGCVNPCLHMATNHHLNAKAQDAEHYMQAKYGNELDMQQINVYITNLILPCTLL